MTWHVIDSRPGVIDDRCMTDTTTPTITPDGSVELDGIDVVHLAADGRFADSTGFFLPS